MHLVEQVIEWAAVVLLVVAGRAGFLYIWPWRPCRWCRPGGLLGGAWPVLLFGDKPKRRRRRRGCWRCRGKRQTRRWGAFHVHKVKLSLAQAWAEREWLR